MKYLYLKLKCGGHHSCWEFGARSKEALLNFHSDRSKVGMRPTATSCLGDGIKKSRVNAMSARFEHQVARLQEAGVDESIIHYLSRRASYER